MRDSDIQAEIDGLRQDMRQLNKNVVEASIRIIKRHLWNKKPAPKKQLPECKWQKPGRKRVKVNRDKMRPGRAKDAARRLKTPNNTASTLSIKRCGRVGSADLH
jgi:hypothetical protein